MSSIDSEISNVDSAKLTASVANEICVSKIVTKRRGIFRGMFRLCHPFPLRLAKFYLTINTSRSDK